MKFSKEYRENLQRVKDCIQFKHTDRLIHLSNIYTWKILDSDRYTRLSAAFRDYQLLEQIQCEFQEKYHFDIHMDLNTRNLIRPTEAMGNHNRIVVNDEKESINYKESVLLEADEYPLYNSNRKEINWRMLCRMFPGSTAGQLIDAYVKQREASAFAAHMQQRMVEDYNCVCVYNTNVSGAVQVPFERFPKYYRGLREASIDMRRHKDVLLDTINQIQENEILPSLRKTLDSMQGQDSPYMADIFIPMLAHAQLSTKQWETFYWPHLKQYLDMITEAGRTAVIYLENSILRFADYFKDYPKGSIIMIIEMDDIFELRKALPNVCLAGGMPSTLLGSGTPEQCVDRVKELIDGLGDGFMLSQDKMISFRNDCNRQNLEAVCEYVNNFRW